MTHARPLLWASGHHHDSHGVTERDGTIFVNAAIHDAQYNPLQPPVVVDIPREMVGRGKCEL